MTDAEQLDGLAFVEGVRDGRWPADPFMVSLDIRVTEALRATAEVLKAGSRIGHVRVEVRDAADRLVATGETTHAVVAVPSSEGPSR
jgi:hypothetical protein